jgi:thiamine transport system substrate-binding protein
MPTQMFVYPVIPNATLPDAFIKYSQAPKQTATLDPKVIAEKRDAWIQAWTDTVMK